MKLEYTYSVCSLLPKYLTRTNAMNCTWHLTMSFFYIYKNTCICFCKLVLMHQQWIKQLLQFLEKKFLYLVFLNQDISEMIRPCYKNRIIFSERYCIRYTGKNMLLLKKSTIFTQSLRNKDLILTKIRYDWIG